jgi:hypothetical protein
MAKVFEMTPDQEKEWQQWLADKPLIIRELAAKYPPDRLYLLKTTGQKGLIESYFEDGTVRMSFDGRYCKVLFAKSVFGLRPADLEECELPGPGETGNYCQENNVDPESLIPEIRKKMIEEGYLDAEGNRKMTNDERLVRMEPAGLAALLRWEIEEHGMTVEEAAAGYEIELARAQLLLAEHPDARI